MDASTSSTTRLLRNVQRNPLNGTDFRARLGCCCFWLFVRFVFEAIYSFISRQCATGQGQNARVEQDFLSTRVWEGHEGGKDTDILREDVEIDISF
jgi:hypothetical protein